MMLKRGLLLIAGLLAALVLSPALAPAVSGVARAEAIDLSLEPPIFVRDIWEGRLPPLAQRLPQVPRVIDLKAAGNEPGRYGGTLRALMGDQRDIRFVTLYGYARLVVFDLEGHIVPDILLNVDVEEGRRFTLHLRPGHRWSDGQPFTSEDFRYWWEDVANDPKLNPGGPPLQMLVEGEPATFEVIDETTVRYSWSKPNPGFLPALAGAQPLVIVMPAHYMKQFHQRYADPLKLSSLIKEVRVKDWTALHDRMSRSYRPENPDLPLLGPWIPRTSPPAEFFVFERNPFFHRVDERGRQLPYIDKITISIGTASLIAAKVAAGGADLQARYLSFADYTFLKEGEARGGYKVRLWERGEGAYVALLPNLNVKDPGWRTVLRDVNVRRALSVAINRRDINQVIFFGLGHEGANTVIPGSPLYDSRYDRAWAQYDPALANKLLDAAGLDRRDDDGIRLLPDGRRAEITVDTAGDSTEQTDILELVGYDWQKIGIKLFVHSAQTNLLRRSVIAGNVMMSIWPGLDNAVPGPDMPPDALAPTNSMQFQWPLWGQYVDSGGREGEKPDDAAAAELADLALQWRRSVSTQERRAIWKRMLEINADQVFTIGVINRTSQPVVVSRQLRNVPETGIYSFEPGAYFGIYMPDTFWFDDGTSGLEVTRD
ncbi:ABC transporter substrate-binding protein [Ancylobacter amanitiformis]|uniref:Peptide/nickel transport system substrate-binding protein n=1 Tax=Ancylobacter amanitiformis TaxID=217069 RepID=A0ABU0LSX2_9HYPH|nr:ABC transporter substrate-binding protein [Ancylobacter amanitiformis]MDQ0511795.1 peptide/nickel transport system substrate-binding protein [Ancylobacter amanitiformis]